MPCAEATGEVGNVAEAGTAQEAGGDGTTVTTSAMREPEFVALQINGPGHELPQGNPGRIFHDVGAMLGGLPYVENGDAISSRGAAP